MSYAKNATSNEVEVIDRNDYYPFGLNFHEGAEFSVTGSPLNYKFGGKELQETGMYDFGARNYMPDVGRWFGADPLAELAPDLSPYRYAFNNPISFTDPTGMYEGDYGGGDYYDDSDRDERGTEDFNIYFQWADTDPYKSDLENILSFNWHIGIEGVSSGGDGREEDDFMSDMSQENGSNDMMNDAVQDSYNNDGPGPRQRSSRDQNNNCCSNYTVTLDMFPSSHINYAYVQNNSDKTVYYKTEDYKSKDDTGKNPLFSKGTTHEKIDGIRVGNTVIKVIDGYRSVIVDRNGHVNITYDNPFSWGYFQYKGGELKTSPDGGWNPLFDKK